MTEPADLFENAVRIAAVQRKRADRAEADRDEFAKRNGILGLCNSRQTEMIREMEGERDRLRTLLVKFRDESSPMNGEGNGLECGWHGGPCKDGRNPNGDEACTACQIRAAVADVLA